ncbi:MAG: hypothetical protein HGA77_04905 [Chlorobiaceae bacterium]|nr:hypothetical protein [Chlorobiaceae bacterium]
MPGLPKGANGRDAVLKIDSVECGTAKAGVKVKNLTVNNEPVDVTSDDDSGWQTFLDEPGQKSVECQVQGVMKNTTFAAKASSSSNIKADVELSIAGIGAWAGVFIISNFKLGANYKESITFEATFKSSGEVTFTAAT